MVQVEAFPYSKLGQKSLERLSGYTARPLPLERLIAENKDGYAEHMYAAVGRRGYILKGGQQVISNKQVAELMRRSVMSTKHCSAPSSCVPSHPGRGRG